MVAFAHGGAGEANIKEVAAKERRRCTEKTSKLLRDHPDHTPVICEASHDSRLGNLKKKLLFPPGALCGGDKGLYDVVTKHVESNMKDGLSAGAPLRILVGGKPTNKEDSLSRLHLERQAKDGILYVTVDVDSEPAKGIAKEGPTTKWKDQACKPLMTAEAQKVRKKYPTRTPVVCEVKAVRTEERLGRKKFLVADKMRSDELEGVLRPGVEEILKANERVTGEALKLRLTIEGKEVEPGLRMRDLDATYCAKDGFLYAMCEVGERPSAASAAASSSGGQLPVQDASKEDAEQQADQVRADLERQVAEKDRQVAEKDRRVAELMAQVAELQRSQTHEAPASPSAAASELVEEAAQTESAESVTAEEGAQIKAESTEVTPVAESVATEEEEQLEAMESAAAVPASESEAAGEGEQVEATEAADAAAPTAESAAAEEVEQDEQAEAAAAADPAEEAEPKEDEEPEAAAPADEPEAAEEVGSQLSAENAADVPQVEPEAALEANDREEETEAAAAPTAESEAAEEEEEEELWNLPEGVETCYLPDLDPDEFIDLSEARVRTLPDAEAEAEDDSLGLTEVVPSEEAAEPAVPTLIESRTESSAASSLAPTTGSDAGEAAPAAPAMAPAVEEDQARRILEKYPGKIPLVLRRACENDLREFKQTKLLLDSKMLCSELRCVIQLKAQQAGSVLNADQMIYFQVGACKPEPAALVGDLYKQYKSDDHFLYMTFGVASKTESEWTNEDGWTMLEQDSL